ncbi:MAG: nitrogen regulation protein NR(II) [Moraxellaceae bacterium]|nr:MAG: nitrogen regulation protein NR(II) [Moraxellaceae bacterium]
MSIEIHKKLLDNLTTAVLLLDAELRIVYTNPAAEHLFATSSSQLLNSPVNSIFYEECGDINELANSLETQHPFTRRETTLVLANCTQSAIVDYTITPLISPSEKMLLMEIRSLDRLIKISREDNIVSAHQATQALIRGVAHEVKNPLGGIRGAAQLLARELHDKSLNEYTDVIIGEADRLRNLVDKMLGPRKLPTLTEVNVHQLLERVRTLLQAEPGHSITIIRDYDPSLPELWADGDQLIQALLNVARNARQALTENPDQQNPSITLRTRILRQFTIGNKKHRLTYVVEIEDNGPGISNELQETLFFPMVSGRANGTGLGLSIAQSILHQHQGLIECDSEPGKTIFRLLLPLESPSEAATTQEQ